MKIDLGKSLVKYEKFIPLVLFLLFVAVTVPGISWGAPSLWNPDELFWRVNMALGGEMKFDETDALAIALCHAFRIKKVTGKTKDWKSFIEANPDRVVG